MAKKPDTKPPVSDDVLAGCLTRAVAEGDIVNFRYIFSSNSPLRDSSPERIEWDKYAYLRPGKERPAREDEARTLIEAPQTWDHIKHQLSLKRPSQLPAAPLLELADNAVRLEKYNAAAQAYELLRIRRRMQEIFFAAGDEALDAGKIDEAVEGYIIATGLDYDYAAFPEPMPTAPNYQARALMLHAMYPRVPEESLAAQPTETHLRLAFEYLLLPEAAGRLAKRPQEQRVAFLTRLVHRRDPEWDAFVQRYHEACDLAEACAARFGGGTEEEDALAKEIAAQRLEEQPEDIPAKLLGRTIENGEWWQYVKELAYRHPPAILFVARQRVSKDSEILLPRFAKNSPLVAALGLERPATVA